MVEQKGTDPATIFQRIAESSSGALMSTRSRFDSRAMKPSWVGTEDWRTLLGDDVNNLYHLSRSVEIVDLYQELDQSSSPQIPSQYPALQTAFGSKYDLLRVVAVLHDIQEALNGDINYHDKNEETERQERFSFMMLSGFLYGDTFSYEMRQELASIIFDRDSELGKEFSIVEKLGYMMTALEAAEVYGNDFKLNHIFPAIDEIQIQELRFGIGQIVVNVLPYQIPQLVKAANASRPVEEFLRRNKDRIDNALLVVPGNRSITNAYQFWDSFCLTPHYDRSSDT